MVQVEVPRYSVFHLLAFWFSEALFGLRVSEVIKFKTYWHKLFAIGLMLRNVFLTVSFTYCMQCLNSAMLAPSRSYSLGIKGANVEVR